MKKTNPIPATTDMIVYTLFSKDKNKIIRTPLFTVDIDSLKGNSWLTDSIIEAYMQAFTNVKNIFVMSYDMCTQLCATGALRTVCRKVTVLLK